MCVSERVKVPAAVGLVSVTIWDSPVAVRPAVTIRGVAVASCSAAPSAVMAVTGVLASVPAKVIRKRGAVAAEVLS